MGRKLGAVPLLRGDGSPSDTLWPGPRPTSVPCFILIHPTVWAQCTKVTDRTDRTVKETGHAGQTEQRSDSIGRTVFTNGPRKTVLHCIVWRCVAMYYNAADLKKYIVDWWLDLEAKCVCGVFLVESKLVIDAEVRQGGDSGFVLWRHLVTISLHIQLLSQLFQLFPTTFITSSPLHLFHCSENYVPQRLMNSNNSFSISTNTSLNTS